MQYYRKFMAKSKHHTDILKNWVCLRNRDASTSVSPNWLISAKSLCRKTYWFCKASSTNLKGKRIIAPGRAESRVC